jgi:transcriptional regulator with XRE-family HTH domain
MDSPIPLPVERAIRKLGSDISLARRRRTFSQASLAERMGASLSTVRRMEKGDVRVPIHFFARALHVFGEIQALENLLDTAKDDIGLMLMDERLPKRVRSKSGGLGSALMAVAPIRQQVQLVHRQGGPAGGLARVCPPGAAREQRLRL